MYVIVYCWSFCYGCVLSRVLCTVCQGDECMLFLQVEYLPTLNMSASAVQVNFVRCTGKLCNISSSVDCESKWIHSLLLASLYHVMWTLFGNHFGPKFVVLGGVLDCWTTVVVKFDSNEMRYKNNVFCLRHPALIWTEIHKLHDLRSRTNNNNNNTKINNAHM